MHRAKTRTRNDGTRYSVQIIGCKGFVRSTLNLYRISMPSAPMNVLFICSRNQWRSPTAERIYQRDDRLSVRSAGVSGSARRRVSNRDIIWADIIVAMEPTHADRLRPMIRRTHSNAALYTLDIPDLYQFMDPELVDLLKDRVEAILP